MENCEKEPSVLSLKDLAQIALGHGGAMKQSNIAVLHDIVQGILKKLNCENEVVVVSGVKSKELKALLCNANRPVLSCGENLKVLTEKFNKLPALEAQVENMEQQLDKHLAVKFKKQKTESKKQFEEANKNFTEFYKNIQQCCSQVSLTEYQTDSGLSFAQPTLQKSRRFLLKESDTNSTITNFPDDTDYLLKKSKIFILDSSDVFSKGSLLSPLPSNSAFYASWKQNTDALQLISLKNAVESAPNEQRISFKEYDFSNEQVGKKGILEQAKEIEDKLAKDKAEKKENEEYKKKEKEYNDKTHITINCQPQVDVTEKKNVPDIPFCYNPCEDPLTIPSPENELPRTLLKSPHLSSKIKEIALWPFERRCFIICKKLTDLEEGLVASVDFWTDLMTKYKDLHSLFQKISDLESKVSNNEVIRMDTIFGMQEIFDQKLDKAEIPGCKQEIRDIFNSLKGSINQVRNEKCCRHAAAILVDNEERDISEETSKECLDEDSKSLCDCTLEQGSTKEPRLVDRIVRMSEVDLQALRERLNHNQMKQIRITSNHIRLASYSDDC